MTQYHASAIIILFFFFLGIGLAFYTNSAEEMPVYKADELYEEIKESKPTYEWEAKDATLDSVWKKTPGINGRKVDVEASYEKMKENGEFDPKRLVFKTVSPKVTMEDLPISPIYRGNPEKEMVSFLINVSWGEDYLPGMIKTLSEKNVKANFFIDGAFARDFTDLVQMIDEEGHTIGSHGFGHKDMGRMSKQQAIVNLETANEFLFALTKQKISYFAPPSGSFNSATVEAADELGMETILWTVDTIDWKKPTKDVLIERVTNKVHNGATILMHPTQVTENSLSALIDQIREKGYRIGALPQLLSPER
ncbi:polysaccharide deacetylase family protein [Halobacillus locisalis]|uniref:Polysaccharide deacetylase family protein n=1 Tax=Halobacillus locisalis TaxID=220753 RepID=A0A838CQ35_9BACI|nr:polysaccharide deacetylase family protein [Halobacillus locisalis]MBA2174061.1 polysaccharide deacetylase family protein [Halobacillus locisalis]